MKVDLEGQWQSGGERGTLKSSRLHGEQERERLCTGEHEMGRKWVGKLLHIGCQVRHSWEQTVLCQGLFGTFL